MRINLLPEPSWLDRVRQWVLTGLAAVLLLANGLLVAFWVGANVALKAQENQMADIEQEIAALQPAYEEHLRLMWLAEQHDVLTQWAASRPSLRADLELLASLLPNQSYITHVELLNEETYWLRAMLPDMASVSTYTRETERHPEIVRVQVLGVERKEKGFQLELQATIHRNG